MSRAISCGCCTSKYLPLIVSTCKTAMRKSRRRKHSRRLLRKKTQRVLSLCHSQRLKGRLIDRCCFCQSAVALVSCKRPARLRADEAVHFTLIVTLLLQRGLHITNYLVRRQVIVGVDGAVPGIIRVGIVAPSREPVTRVPIIWRTKH